VFNYNNYNPNPLSCVYLYREGFSGSDEENMLYMVIERFKTPGALDVYRRVQDQGRQVPQGLEYVSSWVDLEFATCYQLMQTDDVTLFDQWTNYWKDLVDFEIIPVRTSAEAREVIAPRL
jgi:hypothetical protein